MGERGSRPSSAGCIQPSSLARARSARARDSAVHSLDSGRNLYFSMNWNGLKAYANPPWNMISRVLGQVRQQEATIVLVAPVWKTQAWYSLLLTLLIQEPLLIPQTEGLIQPTHPINCPSIQPQLAAWRISGQSSLHREFLRRLQNYCLPPGGKSQARRTTHCSENGLAGVLNGTLIPFLEMSQAW